MKKQLIFILCIVAILFLSGCGNKVDQNDQKMLDFCDKAINVSEKYSNGEISKEKLIEEIRKLNNECPDSSSNVCIMVKAFIRTIDSNANDELIAVNNREMKRTCDYEIENINNK